MALEERLSSARTNPQPGSSCCPTCFRSCSSSWTCLAEDAAGAEEPIQAPRLTGSLGGYLMGGGHQSRPPQLAAAQSIVLLQNKTRATTEITSVLVLLSSLSTWICSSSSSPSHDEKRKSVPAGLGLLVVELGFFSSGLVEALSVAL